MWRSSVLCALFGIAAFGQTLNLEARLEPQTIVQGQPARLLIIIDRQPEEPTLKSPPKASDESVRLSLVQQGQLGGVRIINGVDVSPWVLVYDVKAEKAGIFTIEAPSFTYKGRESRPPRTPIILEVKSPSAIDYAFVDLQVRPESPYLGQEVAIIATVGLEKLRAPAEDPEPLSFHEAARSLFDQGKISPSLDLPFIKDPPFGQGRFDVQAWAEGALAARGQKGFVPQMFENARFRIRGQTEDVTREVFGRKSNFRLYRFEQRLIADRIGRFTVGPVVLDGDLPTRANATQYAWTKTWVASKALEIIVREPPLEGRPADYKGAVGRFRLEVSPPTPNRLRVGDPLYLTVVVSGEGLLEGLSFDLQQLLGDAYQVDAPKVLDSLQPGMPKPQGFPDRPGRWRQFDFKLRVLNPKVTELPAWSWAFFDPIAGRYERAEIAAFPLTIIDSESGSSGVVVATGGLREKDEVELVAASLAANVTDLNRLQPRQLYAWPALLVFLLLWPLQLFIRFAVQRRQRLLGDPALLRRRAAGPRLRQELRHSAERIQSEGASVGAVAALKALEEYVAAMANKASGAVTGEEVLAFARQSQAKPLTIAALSRLVESAEAARFGGFAGEGVAVREDILACQDLVDRAKAVAPGTKALLVLFVLGLFLGPLCGQATEFLAAEALSVKGDHRAAALAYEEALKASPETPYAWFNAGNEWMRAKEIGRAIAAYRRAEFWLRGDQNLARNLSRALSERPAVLAGSDAKPLGRRILFWRDQFGFGTQRNTALGLGLLAFLLGLVRTLRGSWPPLVRPLAWTAGAVALLFALGATLDYLEHTGEERAILIAEEVIARSAPTEDAEPALEQPLRVGAEVKALRVQPEWIEVQLPGNLAVWLPRSTVLLY